MQCETLLVGEGAPSLGEDASGGHTAWVNVVPDQNGLMGVVDRRGDQKSRGGIDCLCSQWSKKGKNRAAAKVSQGCRTLT